MDTNPYWVNYWRMPPHMHLKTWHGYERCASAETMRASGMTWRAIGERLGVSGERARQMIKHAEWIRRRDARLAERTS